MWLILNLPDTLSHQRTAGNQEESLSGEGYLELPIQALQQKAGPYETNSFVLCNMDNKKPAHKQGDLAPGVLGWEQTAGGCTRTFTGAHVQGSTCRTERAGYSSQ